MSVALMGSMQSGFIFAIMALGVYLTFRILDFPDLTVDGSFTTGGAVAATLITAGTAPFLSTIASLGAGVIVGAMTGILHTKGKINPLLSGILSMIALYTINLRIMGKANVPLLGEDTLFTQFDEKWGDYGVLAAVAVIALLIKFLNDRFLHTEIGLAIRATGNNQRMIRSFSTNTDTTIILGLSISNGLVALSGALYAQYQGFADVSMGIGMIVIGLASVIIGEAIFGDKTIFRATFAVIGGAIIYRLVVALAMRVGLAPSDMKLMTALIVIVALVMPRISAGFKERKRRAAHAKTRADGNPSARERSEVKKHA
ncbi:putative ABC transport system permease protein [Aneurinibacillus soli]|uniref:Ribose ABC transporter permease protein n=1 Tax=Aneurinibacillus soli TaxID=1500254 RepID=A0A0U5BEV5_9BACL|nr:ABC transporter permease [Aneurinibacillus soli]PYE59441.1 putative ABC transport system permease protein [Aneurinibacillus soli]BAU29229.1 ribose ABC transporter permease protein [Aneurinibacillus soli]